MEPKQKTIRNSGNSEIKGLGLPLETETHIGSKRRDADEARKDREEKIAQEDRTEARGPRRRLMDPISQQLGATSYYNEMRWPWLSITLNGVHVALTIWRYYGEQNLAIDFGPMNPEIQKEKARLCKENGVRYVYCKDNDELSLLGQKGEH